MHEAALDPDRLAALREAACAASERAYAPYSRFRVGAAVLLDTGTVVTGANVENASYGLSVCAERATVFRAVAEYGPELRILAIAIAHRDAAPSPPCGACRQVLSEFMSGMGVLMFLGPQGEEVRRLDEMMPFVFHLP